MEFPEFFTKILKERRMYKAELGRRIKKTQPYIYLLCKGKKPTPKPKMMAQIIKAVDDLSREEAQKLMDFSYRRVLGDYAPEMIGKQIEVSLPTLGPHQIPILSWESAVRGLNEDVRNIKDIEGKTSTDIKGERLFALKLAKDIGMDPIFKKGEIIVVDPDAKWKSGDYVVLRLNHDDEASFKQIKIQKDKFVLHMMDPYHSDIKLPKKEFEKRVIIIGKVVERKTRF